VAPLVTCACLLDLYSSTGCDFIRMDVGFTPVNNVWSSSYAQLGLFSFDTHETDKNKWKRTFNDGCQLYSENFDGGFIANDQTWYVSRIMAYISGISSLVSLATAWLLTITPLPASFFWPGVLLPAVVLSMLTGAAKFLFFNTQICTEPLWFMDESTAAVPAQSCEIGESSVFGIASVAAYFFCTILICFRSPQKRTLDENFGKRVIEPGSTITNHTGTDIIVRDPELGHGGVVNNTAVAAGRGTLGIERKESMSTIQDSQPTAKIKNASASQIIEHGTHTRSTSDVTWGTGQALSTGSIRNISSSFNERARHVGVLPPPIESETEENRPHSPDVEWNTYGRPIVVTINDNGHAPGGLSYSDGSMTHSGSKSPGVVPNNNILPPRHNGKSTKMRQTNGSSGSRGHSRSGSGNSHSNNNNNSSRNDYDAGSVGSRISRISFTDTQVSEEISALGMQSYSATTSTNKGKPSVVAIPRRGRGHTFSPGSSIQSSGRKMRYKRGAREDRNDVFLNENHHHHHLNQQPPSSVNRLDAKRDILEYLPPLDEMSTTRSLEDHGDLINKCVRDLQRSFHDDGFQTM